MLDKYNLLRFINGDIEGTINLTNCAALPSMIHNGYFDVQETKCGENHMDYPERFKCLTMQVEECFEKIELLEKNLKELDDKNLLRVGRFRDACISMIENESKSINERMELLEKEIENKLKINENKKKSKYTPFPGNCEIIDTERLDFMEKNHIRIGHYEYAEDNLSVRVWNEAGIDRRSKSIREAIDSAIRKKNGMD